MKDDNVYLEHILLAIEKIEEYLHGKSRADFLSDSMLSDAVIRQIEIIGEASKLVSSKTKKKSQELPWKDIAGMRDKLIHAYFGVDNDSVWKTVKEDVPVLKKVVSEILSGK